MLNWLAPDASQAFESTLMSLHKAARRLLVQELGGPETGQLTADDMPRGLVAAQVIGGEYWPAAAPDPPVTLGSDARH